MNTNGIKKDTNQIDQLSPVYENILVREGRHFLSLLGYIKTSTPNGTVEPLHNALIQAFQRFAKVVQTHYSSKIVLAAQYCLCAALDEAIMSTEWGRSTRWSSRTLLEAFYHETFGGERFYTILENMIQTPQETSDLLELQYFLLSLGFKGVYFDKDPLILEAIRQSVFKTLSFRLEKDFDHIFIPKPDPLPNARMNISPLTILGVLFFLLLISVNAFYDYKIDCKIDPFLKRLEMSFME
jgi:type VI secretion system protein ImpK